MNPLYLLGSLAGVGLLVALNWVLLRTQPPALTLQAAQALLARDDPDARLIRLAGDRKAALAEAADGTWFAIAVAGDRLVSRPLRPGFVRRAAANGSVLTLSLDDPGFAKIRVGLSSCAEARDWAARLAPPS